MKCSRQRPGGKPLKLGHPTQYPCFLVLKCCLTHMYFCIWLFTAAYNMNITGNKSCSHAAHILLMPKTFKPSCAQMPYEIKRYDRIFNSDHRLDSLQQIEPRGYPLRDDSCSYVCLRHDTSKEKCLLRIHFLLRMRGKLAGFMGKRK